VDAAKTNAAKTGPRFSSTQLDRSQSRWLSSLLVCARARFGWAIAAPIVVGALLVGQVWLLAHLLGKAVVSAMPMADALPYIAGVVGLILVRAAVSWSGERAASKGSEAVKRLLRQALFERLLVQGPEWTRARVAGEVSSALVDQVEILDGFFTRYIPSAIAAAFLPLAFGVVLLPVDWVAALILLLSAPLIPVFMALVGWGAEAASRRHQRELTRLSGFFADRLRGAFTLKLFGREAVEVDAVRRASHELGRRNMSVLRIAFLSSAVLEFFAALGVAGVAVYVGLTYLGYLHVRPEAMSLPLGLFALFMAPEVYNPLRQFAANYHDRAAARAAAGQLAALFEGLPTARHAGRPGSGAEFEWPRPADCRSSRAAPLSAVAQRVPGAPVADAEDVHVDDLTVYAPGRARAVVRAANIVVERSVHVALMGASGSGKTTLLEALVGVRTPASGRIAVCGQRVLPGHCPGLGGTVALLGQQPFFLPVSIADNLLLARPDAGPHDLHRALAQACATEFVAACPDGLHTLLGVGGYGLSGGQLRRLALARLFLLDPRVMLLDEPTEHLDAATSDQVVASLLRFARHRTMIVATHDPALAQKMDRIYVIDQHGGVHERR
jgi:ATP-binding cassette subfamily C protein CydD